MNWKQLCKIQRDSIKSLENRYNYEAPIIEIITEQFKKEDNGSEFDSKKLRNVVADYCLFLHNNDNIWKPDWKNNIAYHRRTKEMENMLKNIHNYLNPSSKKQTIVNIAFMVLAIQFLCSMYLK